MIARTRQSIQRTGGTTGEATRWAVRSQLLLLGAIVVCTALMPHFLFSTNMGGVSNYGVQPRTVVPYTAGILGEVACLLRAAALLRADDGARTVRAVLFVTCSAITLNLLTTYPYKTSDAWATAHSWSGIALAVLEVGGAAVLVRQTTDRLARAAFALVVLGFALLFLTYAGVLFILFVAESLTATGSGLLLVRVVRAVSEPAGLRTGRLRRSRRARRPRRR